MIYNIKACREIPLMKTIRVTIDPELLHEIDNDGACKGKSRSEFLRQAARYYLKHLRLKSISERYRSGYAKSILRLCSSLLHPQALLRH